MYEDEDVKNVEDLKFWMGRKVDKVSYYKGTFCCNEIGIPYITMGLSGVKEEGNLDGLVALSREEAIRFFQKAFRQHVDIDLGWEIEGDMVLHWRSFPEMHVIPLGEYHKEGFSITARFVVTGV